MVIALLLVSLIFFKKKKEKKSNLILTHTPKIEKVRQAQNASFDAVIVYNLDSDELEIMSASDDSDIFIPSLFVGQTSGSLINFEYVYPNGEHNLNFNLKYF